MGRTSKFTFPLPGRKQKPNPPAPTSVSGKLSKAQKTLGAGDISIDSPTLPNDPSRQWDATSNSGISICISESTASHPPDANAARPDRDDALHKGVDRRGRWEDESAIIPRDLVGGGRRGDRAAGPATTDMNTDASSLRRRESSSTIVSYYDKSKLPLSISQQTSASAIARGLPRKASSILDVDGTRSSAKPKKKPSRLDLSYLLPKSRSSKHLAPGRDAVNDLVLGHDSVSPSLLSASPGVGRLPIESKSTTNSRPKRPSTVDSAEHARARAAASTANLANLYDHYEQRTFRDMSGVGLATATTATAEPPSPSNGHPLPTTSTNDYLSPPFNSAHRTPFSAKSASASAPSGPDTPVMGLVTPSSLVSPPADYAASVSSRHTRTSKASKRTDRSLVDFDLHQNSVLSLSSDSEEDDYTEDAKPFTPAARRPSREWSLSPSSPNSLGLPQATMPPLPDANRANAPRSGRSTPANSHYSEADTSSAIAASSQPRISARTSSLSVSSTATKTAKSRSSVSRLSLASTVTARSATPGAKPTPANASSYGVYDARAINVTAVQSTTQHRNHSQNQHHSVRRQSQTSSHHSDLAPTLSSISIDSYLQSPSNPHSLDDGSIRSGRSMGSVRSGASTSSPRSSYQTGNSSGRMMTVTRQEEMLLAALRMKRARMRENIIAELGAGSESASDEGPAHHSELLPRYQQPGKAPDQPLPPSPRDLGLLDRRAPSSRQSSRRASPNTSRLAPLHEVPQTIMPGHEQQRRGRIPARSAPVRSGAGAERTADDDRERGQILLYFDRPVDNVDDLDAAEPSPDLSDFMDYDDENSDDLPVQTPSDPGPASRSRSRKLHRPPRLSLSAITQGNTAAQGKLLTTLTRSDSGSLSSRSTPSKPHAEDVHVRILEDTADDGIPEDEIAGIPRPDSPISPVDEPLSLPTSLPRRKQVRLSAVGYAPGIETGLWAHDG